MIRMSLSRLRSRAGRAPVLLALALLPVLVTGCVTYTAHIRVEPNGELHITERAEMLPGLADSLDLEPRLVWSAFQSSVESHGGTFRKDRPDSLKGAEGTYPMDDWGEFGQRAQAFKGVDEIERRSRPASVAAEVKDQYFYRDTSLEYSIELTEPTATTVDSVALPFLEQASGRLEIEVPGEILTTNAPQRQGNTLIYPLAYGGNVDVEVTYRELEWVAMVSVVLVAIFLGYLAISGIRSLGRKKRAA